MLQRGQARMMLMAMSLRHLSDPLGIGKNITASSIVSFSNKTGMLNNFNDKKLSTSLNLLLKGDFNFGPVNLHFICLR